MPYVVDAPVAASWLLPDEDDLSSAAAYARLADETALAPSLWWFEIRNVFVISERRGRIDERQTARALSLLSALPVQLDFKAEEKAVLDIARRHRLTVYDAAYLELALREDVELATLDDALKRAARAEGIALLG